MLALLILPTHPLIKIMMMNIKELEEEGIQGMSLGVSR